MNRRSSNPPQRPTFEAPARATDPGQRGQPVTRLRTIDETAELLNTSSRTVRRLIAAGELPAHRFRRLVRISDRDIAVFLAATRCP